MKRDNKRFRQSVFYHINGRNKFILTGYSILLDGIEIGVQRYIETDGPPKYQKRSDVIVCGEEKFDVRKDSDLFAWLWKKVEETGEA